MHSTPETLYLAFNKHIMESISSKFSLDTTHTHEIQFLFRHGDWYLLDITKSYSIFQDNLLSFIALGGITSLKLFAKKPFDEC